MFPTKRGTGPLVVAYGGGVNTIALILELERLGEIPTAIVMADPGSERHGTISYRDEVMAPWLKARGWPPVTVVSLKSEAPFRASRLGPQRTLYEECMEIKALPSIAYGYKKCSLKHKARPSNWWTERQAFAIEAWAHGEKITRAIGYDADEPERARPEILDGLEAQRFQPYYPLLNRGLSRDDCCDMILAAGLRLPPKSACRWCPSNTLQEWYDLRDNDPEGWAEAMSISQNADVESDAVGLMRCNKRGQRTLHLYVFDDRKRTCRPDDGEDPSREAMPCECAL